MNDKTNSFIEKRNLKNDVFPADNPEEIPQLKLSYLIILIETPLDLV